MRRRSAAAAEIVHRRMIAGDQQMIAVVDAAAEGRVHIGAAAPARLACRLVQHDGDAGLGEPQACGKPGEAGPDDVNAAQPRHNKP